MQKHTIELGNKEKFEFYTDEIRAHLHPEEINFWCTSEQIGRLLGFRRPAKAIAKIRQHHERNLCEHTHIMLKGRDEIYLYDLEGMLKLCCYSKQPNYHEVIDFLWSIYDGMRTAIIKTEPEQPEAAQEESSNAPEHDAINLLKQIMHEVKHLSQQISELQTAIEELSSDEEKCVLVSDPWYDHVRQLARVLPL